MAADDCRGLAGAYSAQGLVLGSSLPVGGRHFQQGCRTPRCWWSQFMMACTLHVLACLAHSAIPHDACRNPRCGDSPVPRPLRRPRPLGAVGPGCGALSPPGGRLAPPVPSAGGAQVLERAWCPHSGMGATCGVVWCGVPKPLLPNGTDRDVLHTGKCKTGGLCVYMHVVCSM